MTEARILVVEDEGIIAKDIQKSLQDLGYHVCAVASSGEEAIKKAQEDRPDLVLMDIVLRDKMDGIETAGLLRSNFNIPVVYLTAYTDKKTLERAKVTEPFGYIIKPFEVRELHTAVEMALYKSRMENKLMEREKWLSTILKSIGDAVIVTDEKGRVKFMNGVARSLTGWEEADALGRPLKNIFNIVNENTRQQVEDPVSKVIRKGVVVGLANHTVLIAGDGTEIPIDDSGAPILDDKGNITGIVLVFHDIIERRKSDKALKESEKRYRSLYENALAGLYRSRISDGKIIMANQITADILGYDSTEELIREFAFSKAYAPEKRSNFLKRLEKYGTVSDLEIRLPRKDDKKVDLLISARLYPEDDYIEGAMTDLTETKRLEAKLQQAQKMESIGTLAGGIAHDFNNLLMVIQGYASLILNDFDSTHPNYARLQYIENQVKSGVELTAQLLGLAGGGKYKLEPTDLNKVVKNNAHMFGRTKKEIIIREKYAEDLRLVKVDQGQIEQVLLNIFVNAWQAMPGGGDLYLETSNFKQEQGRADVNVEPGRYVKVSITDTGIGMDKATQRRVFDPFFTTKEMSRGTGLGLASAYGIIKDHGGFINVYSEKNHGSVFNIYLPAIEPDVTIQDSLPDNGKVMRGEGTILLIDDEQIILDVGVDILNSLGYQILPALGGHDAIDIYQAHHNQIDLVILDMVMSGMNGKITYKALKKINPGVKVIIASGYNINGDVTELLEKGANDFIQKPFTIKELSCKIKKVLNQT
ncbi:MAG: response regulator [Thermodesulfobacteriota bacterium]|nr:response regulator [Thermodesulfobacteriota bacterium]